jgi:hypothetical protein
MSEWKKYPKREEPQPQQQPQEAKKESGKWTEVIDALPSGKWKHIQKA